jgi:hypothetical protein
VPEPSWFELRDAGAAISAMGLGSRFSRSTIKWGAVWKTAQWLYRHGRERLDRLSSEERREFVSLMRKSKGRPSNLTAHEKERIQAIVKLMALGKR